MNKLILNFLIVEGYQQGAQKFIKEAAIDMKDPINQDVFIDLQTEQLIDQRMQVRKLILNGEIRKAIALVNEINPMILDE